MQKTLTMEFKGGDPMGEVMGGDTGDGGEERGH